MLFPVQQLLEGKDAPVVVKRADKVSAALAVMVKNDYSQLPVVDSAGNLLGMITEQSIISTYYHTGGAVSIFDLTVDNCETKPYTLPQDRDIFEALDLLESVYAIVIVDGKRPQGILTAYDATHFFRDLSEGLILVEDIEVTLRQYIETVLSDENTMQAALLKAFRPDKQDPTKPGKEYDELSFGEHVQLIATEHNWEKFHTFLEPKEMFIRLMNQVGQVRNQLAHFRGRIEPIQYDALIRARDWLSSRPRPAALGIRDVQKADILVPKTDQNHGEFEALQAWLLSEKAAGETSLRVDFEELEHILQGSLPESARRHRSWWENDLTTHAQAASWLNSGWLVEDVDLEKGYVVFRKSPSALYPGFFAGVVQQLKERRPTYTQARKTGLENWLTLGSGMSGLSFNWVLPKEGAAGGSLRVELYIDVGEKDRNKGIFDALKEHEREIETELSVGLNWERLDHRKASRVSASIPFRLSSADSEEIREAQSWGADMILKFADVFTPYLRNLR